MAAYGLCLAVVVDGTRYESPATGFYVSTTGLALCMTLLPYTQLLHGDFIVSYLAEKSFGLLHLSCAWLAAVYGSMAIMYSSYLFAFLTVLAVYSSLGFSFMCFGLCYMIGFRDKDALSRVAVTSAILLIAQVCSSIFLKKKY